MRPTSHAHHGLVHTCTFITKLVAHIHLFTAAERSTQLSQATSQTPSTFPTQSSSTLPATPTPFSFSASPALASTRAPRSLLSTSVADVAQQQHSVAPALSLEVRNLKVAATNTHPCPASVRPRRE